MSTCCGGDGDGMSDKSMHPVLRYLWHMALTLLCLARVCYWPVYYGLEMGWTGITSRSETFSPKATGGMPSASISAPFGSSSA